MQGKEQREDFLDVAKGIGIILVVYAHIILWTKELSGLLWINDHIYAFHMSLFFAISGYCMNIKYKRNKDNFNLILEFRKLLIRLLLVYFVWSFVYLFFQNASRESLIERMEAIFTFRGIAPIWFLGALFWCELIMILIFALAVKIKENANYFLMVIMFVMVFLSFLFRNGNVYEVFSSKYILITIGRGTICMAIMIVGYFVREMCIPGRLNRILSFIIGATLLVLMCIIVEYFELTVNLHLFQMSNIYIFYVTSVLGSVGTMLVSYSLEKFLGLFKYLGQKTLAIMLFHYIPFYTMVHSVRVAHKFFTNSIAVSAIATVICIVICIVGIKLVEKKFFVT